MLAVDRVDDGLAVVDAQRPRKGGGVGGIQLQGQVGDSLQLLDKMLQRGGFVNAGQTRIDVQHLSARLGLGNRLCAGVGTVAVAQGLLQALFAGRVDALAHHGDALHVHKTHGGTQAAAAHGDFIRGGMCGKGIAQRRNKGGCRAAAAAQHRDARGGVLLHFGGKLGSVQVVAAVRVGQPRVGLDEHRHPGRYAAAQPLGKGQNFLGTQRTVDAHGVRPQPHGGDGVTLHGAARKGAPARLKAHRGEHRQGAGFLGGKDGGL